MKAETAIASAERTRLEFRPDGAAVLTLTRGEAANALDLEGCLALRHSVQAISERSDVSAILLRAEGRAFCVGGDIGTFAASQDPYSLLIAMTEPLHEAIALLRSLPAPVVVAVQGAAAGGGLGLALCGDIVVAARSATFTWGYTAIGLSSDGGASWLVPRLIGVRRTQELAFLNRRLNAEEALDWGLVTRVVDDADLDEVALSILVHLATGSTRAFAAVKEMLDRTFADALPVRLAQESRSMAELAATPESRRLVADFAHRRMKIVDKDRGDG